MKKKLKRGMAFVLVMGMTGGLLSGCGEQAVNTTTEDGQASQNDSSSEGETTEGADTEGQTTEDERYIDDGGLTWDTQENMYVMEDEILSGEQPLTLWVDNEAFGDAIKEGFHAKYPNVDLVVEVVASTDSVGKMSLEGEAGTGADVFIIPHDGVGTAINSAVIGMMGRYSDQIRERYLESAVETIDIDGVIYGVPYLTECVSLIYNKTLLQQLADEGLVDSAEPATDMNQIKELAEKYNDPVNNKWTLRWETGNSYLNYMWLTSAGYQLFGEDHTDPDQVNLDSQEVVDGLNYFSSFRDSWDVNSGDTTWDTTVVEFAKGETPYVISGPWAMETIYEGGEDNGFEVGVSSLPTFDGKQAYTFSGVQLAVVSSYSKYPAAARALAMYIGSDEIMTFVYQDLGKLPALKDGSGVPGLEEDPNVQAFMKQAEYSYAMPAINEIDYYWTSTASMFSAVWDGTLTAQEAADKAQLDYEALRESGQ